LDGVSVALFSDSMVLTLTRTFHIPYGESVLYSCVEITALSDMVSFLGSNRVVPFLIVRGSVARLKVRSVMVFFSRATILNQMKTYALLVRSSA
jgi:hypothetical protein